MVWCLTLLFLITSGLALAQDGDMEVVGVSPSFTQNGEPQDVVVSTEIFNSAGEVMANLILPCGVTGDPTPTVTWYRGDTVLPSQSVTSDGSLVMNVTEGVDASRDGVLYHCEASNVFGSNGSPAVLRSRDVNVTYTFFNGFASTADATVDVLVTEGQAVSLECDFLLSNPPPTIEWRDNNGVIVEDTPANQNLNQIFFTDRGRYLVITILTASQISQTYRCTATGLLLNNTMMMSPTTYTLNNSLPVNELRVYREIGTVIGIVGEEDLDLYHIIASHDGTTNPGATLSRCNVVGRDDITVTVFNIVIARITSMIPEPVGGNRNLEVSCQVIGAGVLTTMPTGTVLISAPARVSSPPAGDPELSRRELLVGGGGVTLVCGLGGSPVPTATWYHNGDPASGVDGIAINGNELIIAGPQVAHSGIYQCFVKNAYGQVIEDDQRAWVLEIREPFGLTPVIYLHPESYVSVDAGGGGGVSLTCVAYGVPLPTLTWLRDGVQLQNDSRTYIKESYFIGDNASFIISILEVCSFLPEDGDVEYGCQALNTHGRENITFQINVTYESPMFHDYPMDNISNVGEDISFTCSAYGIPTPTITWYRNGILLNATNITTETPDNGELPSLQTSVLYLEDVQLAEDGGYSCVIFNSLNDSDSREFTLTVQSASDLVLYPISSATAVGNAATLTCTASGIPPPHITWLKDDTLLSSEMSQNLTEITFSNVSSHFTVSVLMLCNLQFSDSGNYTCSASNNISEGLSTESQSFSLEVQDAPRILVPLLDQQVNSSDEVSLTCLISGSPRPSVQWVFIREGGRRPMLPLSSDNHTLLITESYDTGITTSVLTLLDAQPSQAGVYMCVADNTLGTTNSSRAQITIYMPPSLVSYPGDSLVNISDGISFMCVASGNPMPEIIWSKDGAPLTSQEGEGSGEDIRIDITSVESRSLFVVSILQICDTQISDFGRYACISSSSTFNDSDTREFSVTVFGPPEFTDHPTPELLVLPAGDTTTLSCTAIGFPAPVLKWYRDGTELSVAFLLVAITTEELNPYTTRSNVNIGPISTDSMGSYQCQAEPSFVVSNSTFLELIFPPQLILEPADQALFRPDDITFVCRFEAFLVANVTWTYVVMNSNESIPLSSGDKYTIREERNLSTAITNSSLTISNISVDDAGEYTCTAGNGVPNLIGATTEGTAQLYFEDNDPTLVDPPVSLSVLAGADSTSLECAGASAGELLITWTKDNIEFKPPDQNQIPGNGLVRFDLVFPNPVPSDSGNYTCTVMSPFLMRTLTASALLVVFAPVSIEAFPSNTTVTVETDHTFSCLVFGSHNPKITWFKDDIEIDLNRINNQMLNDTFINSTLTLSNAALSDTATYRCDTSNQVIGAFSAMDTREFYLFVQRAPMISPLSDNRVLLDKALQVNVNFTISDAVPSVAMENISLNFLRYDGVLTSVNYSSQDNLTVVSLLIPLLDIYSDEGSYTLRASNQAGTALGSIHLDVQSPPVLLKIGVSGDVVADNERMAYVAIENAVVTLTCSFLADPQPSLQWLHDGRPIDTDQPLNYTDLGSIVSVSQQLVIVGATTRDTGDYTCNGTNIHGSAASVETLVVIVPPTVIPLESSPIGVETRDGSPSEITVGFSITRALPSVSRDNITWTYFIDATMEQVDLRELADNNSKYIFDESYETLTINNLSYFDAGIVILSASNEAGIKNASLNLTIHVEPYLLNETYSGNFTFENDTALFTCIADGFPAPNIIWIHNSSLLLSALSTRRSVSTLMVNSTFRPHVPLAVSSTLEISGLRSRDSGEYLCRVDPPVIDKGRGILSSPFELSVIPVPIDYCKSMPCGMNGICSNQSTTFLCQCLPLEKPEYKGIDCSTAVIFFEEAIIENDPQSTFSNLLQFASLTCGVVGTPQPSITWYKDGALLEGERSRTLVIREVELKDRGVYTCQAENFDPELNEVILVKDESEDAVVNINGIAQYSASLGGSGRRRRRRQADDSEMILNRMAELLSGVILDGGATIYSITQGNEGGDTILITLLAPSGGSPQLTQALERRLNITSAEIGVSVDGVSRFDGCSADTTTLPPLVKDGLSVVLEWPEVDLGRDYSLPCPCGNLSSITNITIGDASRLCTGDFITGAKWDRAMIEECNFTITTRRLCQVVELIGEPEEAIDMLADITSNEADIGEVEIGLTTIFLETLSGDVAVNSNLSMNFLGVVDNILDANEMEIMMSQAESNSSARILSVVETVAENIPFPENETNIIITLTSFAISVREVDPENFNGQDFSVNVGDSFNFDGNMAIDPDSLSFSESPQATASLSIPDDFFMHLDLSVFAGEDNTTSKALPRIINSVYLSDILFLRREESVLEVGSIIMAASLSGGATVENLTNPITLVFVKKPSVVNGTNSTCNFWNLSADDGFGNWSVEGCMNDFENSTLVICKCNHFTNFAILLDPNPVGPPPPPVVGTVLMAISYIGAILSIICLILTIITYLSSSKLRNTEAGQLLVHLSFALLGLYAMFIISFYTTKPIELCAFTGGVLHYFMLASFFFMAAEAINLYTKLVIVIGIPPILQYRYVLKSALISWLLPFFIVLLSEAPKWTNYINDEFCRPYGASFYGGLMVPFLIVYVFNWIMFFLIFVSLLRKKAKKSELKAGREIKKQGKKQFKQQFIIALTLSLLFGLGWGVGLVATSSIPVQAISLSLQIIFIFLTSFQGLLIFVMHCIRSKVARDEWRRWVYVISCHKITIKPKKKRGHRGGISTTSGADRNITGSQSISTNSDTLREFKKRKGNSTSSNEYTSLPSPRKGSLISTASNEYTSLPSPLSPSPSSILTPSEKTDLSSEYKPRFNFEDKVHLPPIDEEGGVIVNPFATDLFSGSDNEIDHDVTELVLLNPATEDFDIVKVKSIAREMDATSQKGDDGFNILWLAPEVTPAPLPPNETSSAEATREVELELSVRSPPSLSAPPLLDDGSELWVNKAESDMNEGGSDLSDGADLMIEDIV